MFFFFFFLIIFSYHFMLKNADVEKSLSLILSLPP